VADARVVTDGVTFAWLSDVFVATEARGQGVGKMLAAGVMADLEPQGLKRIYFQRQMLTGLTPNIASQN